MPFKSVIVHLPFAFFSSVNHFWNRYFSTTTALLYIYPANMAILPDPKLKQFDAEFVCQNDTPQLEILSMVFGSRSQSYSLQQQCQYVRERDCPFFERMLNAHSQREHDESGPRVLIGQLEPHSVVGKAKNLSFVAFGNRMKSSFYSTMTLEGDDCSMEIWYNLLEDHSSVSGTELELHPRRLYEPLYFAYNFCTGRSIYLLSHNVGPPNLRQSAHALDMHPFSVHIALLYKEVEARSHAVARGLDAMLAIEQRWLEEPLLRTIDTYVIKTDLQSLHRVARLFITCEHRTARDLSHINKLVRDLDRLVAKVSEHPRFVRLDPYMHERIKDGFYSLRDSCENIVRRMQTRRMRVSNMINLVCL